jgi:hypothetical protein
MATTGMKSGWKRAGEQMRAFARRLRRPTGPPRPRGRPDHEAGMSMFTPDFDHTDKSEVTEGGRLSSQRDTFGRD